MAFMGTDFRAGLRQPLYRPFNPAGLATAIWIFITLLIVNQVILQPAFGIGFIAATSGLGDIRTDFVRGALLSVLPAGLLTAVLAWLLARRRNADPKKVLALHMPSLGLLGWLIVIGGFVIGLYILFGIIAWSFGIDVNSSGLVEQAVMQLRASPLYFLIAGGLVIGAPIAEELTFRGQIFAALSQTRVGTMGAAVITSAVWAGIHVTQEWHTIPLLFLMGLALCWLLVRYGSLWITIICHAAWNAVTTILLYFMPLQ